MFNAIVIPIIKTGFMNCLFVFDRKRITLQLVFLICLQTIWLGTPYLVTGLYFKKFFMTLSKNIMQVKSFKLRLELLVGVGGGIWDGAEIETGSSDLIK